MTVVSDSVLTAVYWNREPLATLEKGFDVDLDVGVCRTIDGISCPFEGQRVPTLMDVIDALGTRLGPTVLVEVGYNDPPQTFESAVERAVRAMLADGVQRILWVNFPASSQHWVDMNTALDAVAKRHEELTIVDWDHPSHEQWSWFQGDGIHLVYPGAMAIAGLLNDALVEALAPPPPPPPPPRALPEALPSALVGRAYTSHLVADSGIAPYRWRSVSGPLPRGLRLLVDGTITGVPVRAGRESVTFQVPDARGTGATVTESLVVLGKAPQTDRTTAKTSGATALSP